MAPGSSLSSSGSSVLNSRSSDSSAAKVNKLADAAVACPERLSNFGGHGHAHYVRGRRPWYAGFLHRQNFLQNQM